MSKDLAEFPGKEGLMITVVYPPGASDPIHRHNAYAFLYLLGGLGCDAVERRERKSRSRQARVSMKVPMIFM